MSFPFTLPDSAYNYRDAALKEGRVKHDVWCLQDALRSAGHAIAVDGHFGPRTKESVILWQEGRGLVADGIAGPVTQRDLTLKLAEHWRDLYGLLPNALKSQLGAESACLLGNHSAKYDNPVGWDVGVAQCSTRHHDIGDGFRHEYGVSTLARQVRDRFDTYRQLGKVDERRCWELAHGSWNRPAYCNYLAGMPHDPAKGSVKPTVAQREQLEGYIARSTCYIRWDRL